MKDREIVVCGNYKCLYYDDIGCFAGYIHWRVGEYCVLYLHCNPADLVDKLIVQLGFDAIYHDRYYWTALAIWFTCQRFIPYFRNITGSEDDLLEEVLPQHLVPCAIQFGIDGTLEVGFQSFFIGNRQSDLFVSGKVGYGFTSVKDGCYEIPIV